MADKPDRLPSSTRLTWRSLAACGAAAAAIGLFSARDLAAERIARPVADGAGLWISDSALEDGRRLLIVVDPATRHTAVYHVDPASGSLVLRSTRDISWDLMVGDFNAQDPKPAALRRLLQAGPGPESGQQRP